MRMVGAEPPRDWLREMLLLLLLFPSLLVLELELVDVSRRALALGDENTPRLGVRFGEAGAGAGDGGEGGLGSLHMRPLFFISTLPFCACDGSNDVAGGFIISPCT